MTPRGILTAALSVALLAGTAVAVAPTADAAPAFEASGRPILGDLTADGVPDRIVLGHTSRGGINVCEFELQAGLGGGRFAKPEIGNLPLAATPPTEDQSCPDLGVVLTGPTPALNQLAVTWFEFFPVDGGPMIRTVRGFANHAVRYSGSVDGIFQPSQIESVDFDGDGYGDIWENTDQGSGFQAFVGRSATGWHTLYSTPFTNFAQPQFFDLNRAGGTDILVTWSDFGSAGASSGAAAVDGRTGAVQVLASNSVQDPGSFVDYDLAVTDVNHDAYPDVLLTSNGPVAAEQFINRSQGGRWRFTPLP